MPAEKGQGERARPGRAWLGKPNKHPGYQQDLGHLKSLPVKLLRLIPAYPSSGPYQIAGRRDPTPGPPRHAHLNPIAIVFVSAAVWRV